MLRKIVLVLLLAALAMLVARLAYDPPVIRNVTTVVETSGSGPRTAAHVRRHQGLRPPHQRRQGGEDRLYIAAGLEPEDGAAVVE
jgi:hypothetical protein